MVMFKINDTHTLISEFSSYNFQVLLFSSKHCQTYSCYIIQVLNTFLYYKCCKINHSFTYIQLHKRNDLLYFSPRNIKTVVSLHSFSNEKKKKISQSYYLLQTHVGNWVDPCMSYGWHKFHITNIQHLNDWF